MAENGKGQRITVYFGESDQWQHQSLALALLEMLRREGCSGATVTRGVSGFGAGSRIKTSGVLRLSFDLPMVLTIVDSPTRIAHVLPQLRQMVRGGLITVEEVGIYQYSSRFKEVLPDLPVHEVMTTALTTIHPDTLVSEAVSTLLQHIFTTLPVVDTEQHLLGMLYETDLFTSTDVDLSVSVHEPLDPTKLESVLQQLGLEGRAAETVMRQDVLTIDPETSIRTAAHLMLTRELKQLPVTDATNRLIGIISRIDLLRTVSAGYLPQEGVHPIAVPTGEPPTPVGELMHPSVPSVPPEAPLSEVTATILSARDHCALVINASGILQGIITSSDIVQRLDPDARPGILQLFSHLLRARYAAERQSMRKARAKRAAEIMTSPVVSVTSDMPMSTVLLLATQRRLKHLPVCDMEQRPIGMISRKDLLRAFVQ